MKRFLLCILIALLVSSTACTANTAENDTETETAAAVEETEAIEEGRASVKDNLPETMDFNGEQINVFTRPEAAAYEVLGEEGGDVIYDALFKRNLSVEERLNVKLNLIVTDDNDFNFMAQQVADSVLAGSDDYDILFQRGIQCFMQSQLGYYKDLKNNPYIDLDQPWWWDRINADSAMHESRAYYLAGDITTSAFITNTAAYVNKELMKTYSYDIDELYDAVEAGEWTLDMLEEYCAGTYQDKNGDGVKSDEDIYGCQWLGWNSDYWVYSQGIRYTERDAEGYPELVLNTEKIISYVEDLNHFLHENENVYTLPTGDYLQMIDMFTTDKSLFMMGRLNAAVGVYASSLRTMESAYGILPYPKYDESDSYMSSTGAGSGDLIAVPTTCMSFDVTSAVIEAMCAENYRTVFPAMYDVALKTKYSDSSRDAQMIDIIHDSASIDFTFLANLKVSLPMIGLVQQGSNDFASSYASAKARNDQSMEEMIAEYKKIDH